MKKHIYKLLTGIGFLLAGILSVQAQDATEIKSLSELLDSITKNNISLQSYQLNMEANMQSNLSNTSLDNPEIGFNYLIGSPDEIGNRTDISVSQPLDWNVIFGQKRKSAKSKNEIERQSYELQKAEILLEAKKSLILLNGKKALKEFVRKQVAQAEEISSLYTKMMENGECSLLDLNKANANLSNTKGEYLEIEVEEQILQDKLEELNGGKDLSFADSFVMSDELPNDFETWYQSAYDKNIQYVLSENKLQNAKEILKETKTEAIPGLSIGYMREQTKSDTYNGITLGIDLPLWNSRKKVKESKLRYEAFEKEKEDGALKLKYTMQTYYTKAVGLKKIAENRRYTLTQFSNEILLSKALKAGEISLLNFILESNFYYESYKQAINAEMEYNLALAELFALINTF